MPNSEEQDKYWMEHAIEAARAAEALGEVPVGAVVVCENRLVATGYNQSIARCDPTAHAEMVAMRAAATALANYRLTEATLYVTLEPCAMCAGAMLHARIKRVVYGAADPKTGALGGVINLWNLGSWNHRIEAEGGVLADTCGQLLKSFFQKRR